MPQVLRNTLLSARDLLVTAGDRVIAGETVIARWPATVTSVTS